MRPVSLIAATAAALFLAFPALAEDKVVNVYNWSDYIDPATLEAFTKETGIKVVYDTMDSNEVLETKLLAGQTGYDVVVPTGSFLQRQIKADIYLPLDKAKVPNLKYAWEKVYAKLAVYDPDNAHAVNYMWGTTGIGYNAKNAREILGPGQKIDSWKAVFHLLPSGGPSPARIARTTLNPLTPVKSLITSWNLMFIRSRAFCICCSQLAAAAM